MIKNFKKLFAIILVFIFSSFYIVNINTFADELIYPFDMDGFESKTNKGTDPSALVEPPPSAIFHQGYDSSPESYSPVRSFVSCDSISPDLKNQLDHAFGELQEIHPEIKADTDDYKMNLALICTYLQDLSRSNIPYQNQTFCRHYKALCDEAKNNMRPLINSAVCELYGINLSDIHFENGYYGYDGFDFLYLISGMDSFEIVLDDEIQGNLKDYGLDQIFGPMETNPDYSRLVY